MRKRRIGITILIAACALLAALCIGAYFLMNARSVQLAGNIVMQADTEERKIALTFDDGPTENTEEILAMLDELDVKCTFFLTGEAMQIDMDATKAIAAAGHQIGNHSYSHDRMIFRNAQWIANEIERTNALIREAGYNGTIYFRPPYCKKLLLLPLALAQRDMTTVTWSVETEGCESADDVVEAVARQTQPGAIILLHIMADAGETERKAVPGIVKKLREQGYEFVTVEELLTSAQCLS